MSETIPTQYAIYLIILWFFTARQLGYCGAKYTRAKKSSWIWFIILATISMAATMWVVKP